MRLWSRRRPNWKPAEIEAALPGVTSVPWERLRGVTGEPATSFPRLLAALVIEPFDDLRDILSEALGANGLWAQATPFAVPFLIQVAKDQNHPRGADIAQLLLEDVAYGEPHRSEIDAGNTELRTQMETAFEMGRPFFESQVRTGDPGSQAVAISILAAMDHGSGRLRKVLGDIDVEHADRVVVEAVRDAYDYLDDV